MRNLIVIPAYNESARIEHALERNGRLNEHHAHSLGALEQLQHDRKSAYGVDVRSGPLTGLTARAVVVIDENDNVVHAELVGYYRGL